jgi:hypothetical protein
MGYRTVPVPIRYRISSIRTFSPNHKLQGIKSFNIRKCKGLQNKHLWILILLYWCLCEVGYRYRYRIRLMSAEFTVYGTVPLLGNILVLNGSGRGRGGFLKYRTVGTTSTHCTYGTGYHTVPTITKKNFSLISVLL